MMTLDPAKVPVVLVGLRTNVYISNKKKKAKAINTFSIKFKKSIMELVNTSLSF